MNYIQPRIHFVALIALILLSCNNSKDKYSLGREKTNYTHYLQEDSTILFEIDDSTSFRSNYLSVSRLDKQEILAAQNDHKNAIDIFMVKTGEKIRTIRLPREGPGSIRQIYGFTLINQDSVFVYSHQTLSNVLLIDFSGNFIGAYDLTGKKYSRVFNHGSMTRSPVIFHKKQLHFVAFPHNEYRYDLRNNSFVEKEDIVPEYYQGRDYGPMHSYPNRCKGPNDTFLYSWGADPQIHVVDGAGNWSSYTASSDFFDEIEPMNNDEGTRSSSKDFYLMNDFYDVIIWDKYRNVYYRVAKQGVPLINPKTGNRSNSEDRSCSIIILDRSFQKIGETKLPPNKYFVRDWFLSEQGLFISNNHYLNPDLSEDHLRFTRLVLKHL